MSKYIVHWGDGTTDSVNATDLPSDRTLQHTYADDSSMQTIAVDLVDEDCMLPGGELDVSFGQGGTTNVNFGGYYSQGYSVAAAPDGSSVVLAYAGYSLRFLRFDADGSPDRTFGSDGSVAFDYSINPGSGGIALDAIGRVLVPGYVYNYSTGGYTLAVARYNADGSLDTTFGSAGIAETDLGSGYAIGNGVAVDGAGPNLGDGVRLQLHRLYASHRPRSFHPRWQPRSHVC